MRNFINTVRAILIKDLLSELRAKQILAAMIVLGLLIAVVFRMAAGTGSTDDSAVAAAVLLVSLLFAGILSSERVFAVEEENDSISALLLAAADAGDIYIGKLLVNIAMLCIFEIVVAPAAVAIFNVNVSGRWLMLAVTLLLVNVGISGIGTLLGCAVQRTRAAGAILSILVMAVFLPIMIPAIIALLSLLEPAAGGSLAISENYRRAIGLLTAFDAVFVTASWLLFGFVIRQ